MHTVCVAIFYAIIDNEIMHFDDNIYVMVYLIILNIRWLHAHQIMVTYPVNGLFLCLDNGQCSTISAPFNV